MQIILKEQEFKEAIVCYLSNQGFDANRYDISIRIVQGRGVTPTRAEVELLPIEDMEDAPPFEEEQQEPVKTLPPEKPKMGSIFGSTKVS